MSGISVPAWSELLIEVRNNEDVAADGTHGDNNAL